MLQKNAIRRNCDEMIRIKRDFTKTQERAQMLFPLLQNPRRPKSTRHKCLQRDNSLIRKSKTPSQHIKKVVSSSREPFSTAAILINSRPPQSLRHTKSQSSLLLNQTRSFFLGITPCFHSFCSGKYIIPREDGLPQPVPTQISYWRNAQRRTK